MTKKIKICLHQLGWSEKLFFFLSGAIISSLFPIMANFLVLYLVLSNFSTLNAELLSIVLIAPVLEEFAKMFPLLYRHGETERSLVILGLFVGLGFGLSEFFLYVLVVKAGILVRLLLIVFHGSTTVISSFGIAKNRILQFYLLAVILHMLYNYFVISNHMVYAVFIGTFSLAIAMFSFWKTSDSKFAQDM